MLLAKFKLLNLLLITYSQARLSLATSVQGLVEARKTRAPLHACAIFAQRWFDNSFDLEAFGYNWTATGPFEGIAKADVETVTQPVGTVFTTLDNIGSYSVATTNVADPAVVNGQVDWNDPGKLSFQWGTTKFDTFSPGNTCVTIAVGFSPYGFATNYTCPFQCDS